MNSLNSKFVTSCLNHTFHCFGLDKPPKVTSQPKSLKRVAPETAVSFTIQATGTEPLNYLWQWKSAEENRSEGWHSCPAEWSDGATLTIPSVQKPNEGRYHCVISNCAGRVISKPVLLSVGKTKGFLHTGT